MSPGVNPYPIRMLDIIESEALPAQIRCYTTAYLQYVVDSHVNPPYSKSSIATVKKELARRLLNG